MPDAASSIVYLHLDDPMVPDGKIGTSPLAGKDEKSITMSCAGGCGLELTFSPNPLYKILAASCTKCRPQWRTKIQRHNLQNESITPSKQTETEASALPEKEKSEPKSEPSKQSAIKSNPKSRPARTATSGSVKKVAGRRVKGRVNLRGLD